MNGLKRIPVSRIITAIDRASARFIDARSPVRARAVKAVAAETGFAPAMVELALDWTFAELSADAMRRLVASEFGDENASDNPALHSHETVFWISAGFIFQPVVNGAVFSLLLKSRPVIKCSAHENSLMPLWAEMLADIDDDVGRAVQVISGQTADSADVERSFAGAGVVVAFGSNDSLTAVGRRIRTGTKFIGHGHKVSVAALGAMATDAEARRNAALLALDISMYEQSGCLSPQNIFMQAGGGVSVERFAGILAGELLAMAVRFPVHATDIGQAAAIETVRREFEFLSAQDTGVKCLRGDAKSFTVIVDPDPSFRPSPLGRTIFLKSFANTGGLINAMAPLSGQLQAVGEWPKGMISPIRPDLDRMGASYICEIGHMQRPPLDWKNAGIPCLRSLLTS